MLPPQGRAVRTWFQIVQFVTYPAHRFAASVLTGSTAASASLRGTLNALVTSTVPTR